MKITKKIMLVLVCSLGLSACVGTIVGTAVDVAVEVAKVPFKVGGAVVDVITGDDLTEQGEGEERRSIQDEAENDAIADEQFAL